MTNNNIRPVSRFFIYLVDFFIISAIVSLLCPLAFQVVNFDVDAYNAASELMNDSLVAYMDGEISFSQLTNSIESYMEYENQIRLIKIVLSFIVMIPYLVIIPLKWKGQTVGRKILQAKVLMQDGSEPNLRVLALRELVGSFIFYIVLAEYIPFIVIVYLILACYKRISIVEIISKTKMVPNTPYYVVVDENEYPNYDRFEDDYIKADFKVVDDRINADDLADEEADADSDEYKIL